MPPPTHELHLSGPAASGPPPAWAGTITHQACGTSTMDLARASRGASHGHSWRLDRQTHGRGRRGRSWSSHGHAGLWMTTLLQPSRQAGISALCVVAGLSLLEVVHQMGAGQACLKWPNDIWVKGRKLAGILLEAESRHTPEGPVSSVYVGIGVNLEPPPSELGGTGLLACLQAPPPASGDLECLRARLAAAFSAQLSRDFASWHHAGLAPMAARLAAHDALAGAQVRITPGQGADSYRGLAAGIAADGSLRVETDRGTQWVWAGEVERIRRA